MKVAYAVFLSAIVVPLASAQDVQPRRMRNDVVRGRRHLEAHGSMHTAESADAKSGKEAVDAKAKKASTSKTSSSKSSSSKSSSSKSSSSKSSSSKSSKSMEGSMSTKAAKLFKPKSTKESTGVEEDSAYSSDHHEFMSMGKAGKEDEAFVDDYEDEDVGMMSMHGKTSKEEMPSGDEEDDDVEMSMGKAAKGEEDDMSMANAKATKVFKSKSSKAGSSISSKDIMSIGVSGKSSKASMDVMSVGEGPFKGKSSKSTSGKSGKAGPFHGKGEKMSMTSVDEEYSMTASSADGAHSMAGSKAKKGSMSMQGHVGIFD